MCCSFSILVDSLVYLLSLLQSHHPHKSRSVIEVGQIDNKLAGSPYSALTLAKGSCDVALSYESHWQLVQN